MIYIILRTTSDCDSIEGSNFLQGGFPLTVLIYVYESCYTKIQFGGGHWPFAIIAHSFSQPMNMDLGN